MQPEIIRDHHGICDNRDLSLREWAPDQHLHAQRLLEDAQAAASPWPDGGHLPCQPAPPAENTARATAYGLLCGVLIAVAVIGIACLLAVAFLPGWDYVVQHHVTGRLPE